LAFVLRSQAFYMSKQYRRVLLLLRSEGNEHLLEENIRFRYLAAKVRGLGHAGRVSDAWSVVELPAC
jgi:hypothetical protein